MSVKSLLRALLSDTENPGETKETIMLSNGASIEVEPRPDYKGTQWLWRINGQIFSIDDTAERYLRQLVYEKLTGKRVLLKAMGKKPEICGETCPHPAHDRASCLNCPVAEESNAIKDGVELVYAAGNPQLKALTAILKAVQDFGFGVTVYEENGEECGLYLEDWTPNGVDMVHFLDMRDEDYPYAPYTLADLIQDCADRFDPDEEVEVHTQDPKFREAFSYFEAAKEFEGWGERLNELANFVQDALGEATRGQCVAMRVDNNLSYKKILEEI